MRAVYASCHAAPAALVQHLVVSAEAVRARPAAQPAGSPPIQIRLNRHQLDAPMKRLIPRPTFVTAGSDWVDARYDAMIAEAQSTPDRVRRWRKLAECEKYLLRAMPVIP